MADFFVFTHVRLDFLGRGRHLSLVKQTILLFTANRSVFFGPSRKAQGFQKTHLLFELTDVRILIRNIVLVLRQISFIFS